MTWEEREKADERITIRANRVRERRFKSGLAMAPYNTTQFLMAQVCQLLSLTKFPRPLLYCDYDTCSLLGWGS